MSPRKVRLVAGLVRGKKADYALSQLKFVGKVAGQPVAKLIESAIANAVNNFGLEKSNLFVKEITVDGGPTIKRWTPRAHGRATPINKRTSHVSVTLGELKDSGIHEGKKVVAAEPVKLSNEPKTDKGIKISDKDVDDQRIEGRIVDQKQEGAGATKGKGFSKKVFNRKSG